MQLETITPEILESIAERDNDKYELLSEDYVDECNGDWDAVNYIVFRERKTNKLYRAVWFKNSFDFFGKTKEELTIEEVKEVKVIDYRRVNTIQGESMEYYIA